jgi:hypothetical protein
MTSAQATPSVPVSWGELLDKITILEIKEERIADPAARSNVRRELGLLRAIAAPALEEPAATRLLATLRRINERLWDIEDDIRRKEAQADFGPAFIALARAVYKTNDQRAALKKELNGLLNSELVEEKSYAPSAFFTQEGR